MSVDITDGRFTYTLHAKRTEYRSRPHKGTCACGRVRKLYPKDEWRWLCSECYYKTYEEIRDSRKPKESKPRFAYPCVGGPLDGLFATTNDFYHESGKPGSEYYRPEGLYAHLEHDYYSYNSASGGRGGPSKKGKPSMIFVHTSCLKSLISPKQR